MFAVWRRSPTTRKVVFTRVYIRAGGCNTCTPEFDTLLQVNEMFGKGQNDCRPIAGQAQCRVSRRMTHYVTTASRLNCAS